LFKDVDLQMFTVKRGHENILARNQSICCTQGPDKGGPRGAMPRGGTFRGVGTFGEKKGQ